MRGVQHAEQATRAAADCVGFAHSAAALFADLRGRYQHVTTWFLVSGAYLFVTFRATIAGCCLPCRRGPLFSSSSVCVTDVGCCLPTCCGKLSSPSESAKFDASACLLGTLLVTFFCRGAPAWHGLRHRCRRLLARLLVDSWSLQAKAPKLTHFSVNPCIPRARAVF